MKKMRKLMLALTTLSFSVASTVVLPSPAHAYSEPAVKMSRNMICHPRGGTYYSRTIHYTPYASMAACIRDGGRAPLR
jgi:hypothetical protein